MPKAPIVLKLYVLCEELCGLVDKGQIRLDQAIEIWERGRAEGVVQRFKEDAETNPKLTR